MVERLKRGKPCVLSPTSWNFRMTVLLYLHQTLNQKVIG